MLNPDRHHAAASSIADHDRSTAEHSGSYGALFDDALLEDQDLLFRLMVDEANIKRQSEHKVGGAGGQGIAADQAGNHHDATAPQLAFTDEYGAARNQEEEDEFLAQALALSQQEELQRQQAAAAAGGTVDGSGGSGGAPQSGAAMEQPSAPPHPPPG
jgi:hypothetical protein